MLAAMIAVSALIVFGLYLSAESRLSKTYPIAVESLTIPTGAQAVARGQHLAAVYCADCHGDNSEGMVILDDPAIGHVEAHNLTGGKGGLGDEYGDADWIRAIRYGVSPEGEALLGMPSADFYNLSDNDLGDLIAYLKVLPPIDAERQEPSLTQFGQVLLATGALGNVLQAEGIDRSGVRPPEPAPAVSAAYGEYLARTAGCQTCHGKDLTGGKGANALSPSAPDITTSGALRLRPERVFIREAQARVGEFMPWKTLNSMSDDELKALWLYLKSLPGKRP